MVVDAITGDATCGPKSLARNMRAAACAMFLGAAGFSPHSFDKTTT